MTGSRTTAAAPPAGASLAGLLDSWELNLAERGLSPRTREVYMRTGRQLTAWLAAEGRPGDTERIDAPDLRAFLAAEVDRTSPVSAHQHYRNLRVLFKWLARERERTGENPMLRVDAPKVVEEIKPILSQVDLSLMLRTCDGQDFEARRDLAVLRILIDTGVRVSGLGNVQVADVDLPGKLIRVTLKGGERSYIPLGRKAAAALDRYLRARARHQLAESPWLWLGVAGRDRSHFGAGGIQDMIARRGKEAGVGKVTPHAFRRTFAHEWLAAGGSELDAMRIAGWKTRAMIARYAGQLASQRAREAHARLNLGDQL